jgi:hypothetical protein
MSDVSRFALHDQTPLDRAVQFKKVSRLGRQSAD